MWLFLINYRTVDNVREAISIWDGSNGTISNIIPNYDKLVNIYMNKSLASSNSVGLTVSDKLHIKTYYKVLDTLSRYENDSKARDLMLIMNASFMDIISGGDEDERV